MLLKLLDVAYQQDIFPMCHQPVPYLGYVIICIWSSSGFFFYINTERFYAF